MTTVHDNKNTNHTGVKHYAFVSEYTGKINDAHTSVMVNCFPPLGEKHTLYVTGQQEGYNYFIETKMYKVKKSKSNRSKSGKTRITKTFILAEGPRQTLRLKAKLRKEVRQVRDFIAGMGVVPTEDEVKTVDDYKKYYIYNNLCKQAAAMISNTVTDEQNYTITKETDTVISISDKLKKYGRNPEPKYRWKKGIDVRAVDELKVTFEFSDHSIVALRAKTIVLKGEMQSGKTRWMITRSLMDVYNRKTAIIVLRELSDDQMQLLGRIKKINEHYIAFAKKKFDIDLNSMVEIVEDIHELAKSSDKEKQDIMTGVTPKFIACISNMSPLNKLVDMIRVTKRPQYSLYIDESDYVDVGDSSKRCTGKSTALDILKTCAYRVTMVSATIIENIYHNDVKPENMFWLEPPSCYKGVRQFDFCATDEKITFSSRVDSNFFETDPGLEKHMNALAEQPLFCDSTGRSMPPIHLFNLGSAVEAQKTVQQNLIKMCPNITSIVYNGEGIYFYSPHFATKSIIIGEKKMIKEGPIHQGRITMADMLGFCESHGVNVFPRIAIFSGKLAGRGISYVSGKMENGIGWHVNALRLARSITMTNASLLQAIGRLCGCFNDNVPLRLYVDQSTCDAVWTAYQQQEQLLPKARVLAIESGGLMKKALLSQPISIDQRGDRNISATVNRTAFKNIVSKEKAGTWDARPGAPDVIDEVENEENAKSNDINSGDALRLIVPSMISRGTILERIYNATVRVVLEEAGTGVWVNRTKITRALKGISTDAGIRGHLCCIYQTKYTMDNIDGKQGLFMRKRGDIVQLMVN